ncbi:MAG: hypothetical protein JWN15_2575, partial [Firmicutes bacterium]|nr:hypothetical protein [Bacillota bacterium]
MISYTVKTNRGMAFTLTKGE